MPRDERGVTRVELTPSQAYEHIRESLASYLETANSRSLIGGTSEPYGLAAAAVRTLLSVSRP